MARRNAFNMTARQRWGGPALAVLAFAIAGVANSAQAQAQDGSQQPTATASSTSAPASANEVDTLVVTARRSAERVRDVPATISAVSASDLEAIGPVTGTGDLLRTAPGVRFNDLSAPNLGEVSIRGSGTQRATGADSSVGLFVNGAYVGSSTLGGRNFRNIDFFDLERVETLKGPQGALYGRNSEFGTINVVLAKPQFRTGGYISDTATAELNQNKFTAVYNTTLGDEFAIRVGGQYVDQNKGFYKNTNNGKYYDHTEGWIGRGQARWRHGPLDVNFMYDAEDMWLPVFSNAYVLPAGAAAALPLGYTSDIYNIPHTGQDDTHQTVQRAMLTVDYDLDWAKVTSTTMSSNFHSDQHYAAAIDLSTETMFQSLGEAGVYPLSQVTTHAKDNTIYEDLHATGMLFSRLTWLLGAEYLYQRDSNTVISATNPCTLTATSGICGGQPGALVCYRLTPKSTACPAVYPASFGTSQVTPQQYRSSAVYGSLRYNFGYGFNFSGDLRYTSDDKNVQQNAYLLYTLTPSGKNSAYEFKSNRTNYSATLSWKPDLPAEYEQLLYVRTGTGYRAGGINPGVSSPLAPNPFMSTYDNEDTTSYEAGIKGNLGRNVYFTLAGYKSRTKNAIASILDGCTILNACKQAGTLFNINAGTEDSNGVEASVTGRFDLGGGRLTASLNGSKQKATYVAVRAGYSGVPIVGSSVAQLPDSTASATLDYRHGLGGGVLGFGNVTWSGQWGGSQDAITATAPEVPLTDYNLFSARAGINFKKVQLALFVKNLTDEQFPVLKLQYAAGIPLSYRYNQPRTFGLDLSYRW